MARTTHPATNMVQRVSRLGAAASVVSGVPRLRAASMVSAMPMRGCEDTTRGRGVHVDGMDRHAVHAATNGVLGMVIRGPGGFETLL